MQLAYAKGCREEAEKERRFGSIWSDTPQPIGQETLKLLMETNISATIQLKPIYSRFIYKDQTR